MKTITLRVSDRDYEDFVRVAANDSDGVLDVHEFLTEHVVDWLNSSRRCRVCGCSDYSCGRCVERTGDACTWVEDDLCSACAPRPADPTAIIDAPAVYDNGTGKRFVIKRRFDGVVQYWNSKREVWISSSVIHGGSQLNPKPSFFSEEGALKELAKLIGGGKPK